MKRIAINGFGRIGRLAFRLIHQREDMEVVAINDLTDAPTLAHLLKYDSAHGIWPGEVSATDQGIHAGGHHLRVYAERDPSALPWADLGIDVVLECTGVFRDAQGMGLHLKAGAGKVILSAPPKDKEVPSIVLGVNEDILRSDMDLLSCSSCTTNCLAPVIRIMDEVFGIESGFVTTTHAYTADQRLHDAPHRDLRRARAAAANIVPTTTGAAKAVGVVYPRMAGRLDAIAMRVPVITGSLVDVCLLLDNDTSAEAINDVFRKAAASSHRHIVQYCEAPIVSSDIIGNLHSSIFDSLLTSVQGRLAKVVAWYDNEAGYAARLVDLAAMISRT
jgi:glyceraldehyde 3-phosphate dehydrogenase